MLELAPPLRCKDGAGGKLGGEADTQHPQGQVFPAHVRVFMIANK